eukprot:CAMPEP_0181308370 /NCGR_PEP_ID=MMETSP1101-20121128/11426_1 /TAXON_ID=46948 /ORGANISM="Rhodomonas abbreviata, Strain Caron Lab Isolate" /LENGTH=795 /DNA_ID=CAMNT_0023414747 /DNA_START=269 /DNA_END=2657 /DNA_ORIENTATION=-
MSISSCGSTASTAADSDSICSREPPGGPVDQADIIKSTASDKMLLILQCVGSVPASQHLANEMNRVLATVDAIARQRSFTQDEDKSARFSDSFAHDGEKAEVMKQAAVYLATAKVDKKVGHLVVKIKGAANFDVVRIVCVIKSIMTASSSAGIPLSIGLHDPEKANRTAMIEVLQGELDGQAAAAPEEERKEALLQHLDLLPDKDLKFIEEEVVSFVDNPTRVSRRMRIIMQALEAAHRTPELVEEVDAVITEAENRKNLGKQVLDFSYLVDLDKETGTAKLRFDLASDDMPETLAVIRLVLDSCVEAGAELLAVELVDGDKHAVVAVSPFDGSASVKLSVVDPRCATSVQPPPFIPSRSPSSASRLPSSAPRAPSSASRVRSSASRLPPPASHLPFVIDRVSSALPGAGDGDCDLLGDEDCAEDADAEEEEGEDEHNESVLSCAIEDMDNESVKIRLVLEALGAVRATPMLAELVEEVLVRAEASKAEANALDFSYLMDVDEETGTASLRFDLSEQGGKEVHETLAVIQVVLASCVEAGARQLAVELLDDDGKTAHVMLHTSDDGVDKSTALTSSADDARCSSSSNASSMHNNTHTAGVNTSTTNNNNNLLASNPNTTTNNNTHNNFHAAGGGGHNSSSSRSLRPLASSSTTNAHSAEHTLFLRSESAASSASALSQPNVWAAEDEIARIASLRKGGRQEGEAEAAIEKFMQCRAEEVVAMGADAMEEWLFELGHHCLDVGKDFGSEAAEAQRTVTYDNVVELLHACPSNGATSRRVRMLQLHLKRLLHLLSVQ